MRTLVTAITAAGVLSLGATGTAFAAQDDAKDDAKDAPKTAEEQTERPRDDARHRVKRGTLKVAAEAAARAIGIDAAELRAAIRGGTTVAEVATSKGVDVQSVQDAIVLALTARVDERVAAGDLDAERAARLEERLAGLAEKLVNHEPKAPPER